LGNATDSFGNVTKDASEMAGDLWGKRRLLQVDIQGLLAKVAAAEKLIADLTKAKTASPARLEQLESIKMAAELELVDLKAREARVGEMIDAAHRVVAWGEFPNVRTRKEIIEAKTKALEARVAQTGPWPPLVVQQPVRISENVFPGPAAPSGTAPPPDGR